MAKYCFRLAEHAVRQGRGRWVILILKTCATAPCGPTSAPAGFQSVPTPVADSLPVLKVITAAPGTASDAFDYLPDMYGESRIVAGDPDIRRPDKVSKR